MTKKKRRLGKGLDALLGDATAAAADVEQRLKEIPVDLLRRGRYQPRTSMEKKALQELAQSIQARGVVQPIMVRPVGNGDYEIIAGERRWRAAQIAQLETVPVIVREIPDEDALAIGLIENIQREDLNPIEEATGLRRLLDDFGLTHEEVARGVGRSRSAVTNILRLLALSRKARELLEKGALEMGHARALLVLPKGKQDAAAREVVAKGLSVRQTEALVKRLQTAKTEISTPRSADPDVKRLQERLSDKLGAKVRIQNSKGRGKLIIEYHSLDELDGILKRIR